MSVRYTQMRTLKFIGSAIKEEEDGLEEVCNFENSETWQGTINLGPCTE